MGRAQGRARLTRNPQTIILLDHTLRPLRKLVGFFLAAQSVYVCIACLIMAFTFFFVVIFRYIFATDLFAYEEWLLIICFWLYFMASAIGTFENSHVNADLLEYVIKSPTIRWARSLLVVAIEFIVCLFAIYWSILMIQDEIGSYPYWQTTIALKIPLPPTANRGSGRLQFHGLLFGAAPLRPNQAGARRALSETAQESGTSGAPSKAE